MTGANIIGLKYAKCRYWIIGLEVYDANIIGSENAFFLMQEICTSIVQCFSVGVFSAPPHTTNFFWKISENFI